jgi:hypothetical protein
VDEASRRREDDWFLQHEKKLLEDARKAREKREKERKARETEEERARLRQLHWMKCPKCGHDYEDGVPGRDRGRPLHLLRGFFLDQGEIEELFLEEGRAQRQSFMRRLLGM